MNLLCFGCFLLCFIALDLAFFVALAEVWGFHALAGARGTLLGYFNLSEVAFVTTNVVDAFAYITNYTCVFHFYHHLCGVSITLWWVEYTA